MFSPTASLDEDLFSGMRSCPGYCSLASWIYVWNSVVFYSLGVVVVGYLEIMRLMVCELFF